MSVELSKEQVESRAECLMLMDKLLRHLNDEADLDDWLINGVPDGAPDLHMPAELLDYYKDYVHDFEDFVELFARTIRRVCLRVNFTYEKKGFC